MSWKRWGVATGIVAGCFLVGVTLGSVPEALGQDSYKARLSPLPADAKTRQEMLGSGTVTAMLSGAKLTINGSFTGLKTAATMAKLQNGVAPAVRGPAIADLTITKATSGTITGSAELTPDQIAHFKKGGLYVQLFTEKPADGTLWGWFLK